jgi:hypothetical protein
MPTSTVKNVNYLREWEHPASKNMIYYFDIEFEDGVKGEFSTTKKDQNKFIPGEEVEYTIEKKSSQSKGEYLKIDKKKTEENKSALPAKQWKKDPKVRKLIVAQTGVKCAIESLELPVVIDGKEVILKDIVKTPQNVLDLAAKYNNWIHDNSGDNEQMEIILQGQVHNAIKCHVAPALEIKSSDKVLEVAKIFRDGILKIAKIEGGNEL